MDAAGAPFGGGAAAAAEEVAGTEMP